MGAEGFVKIGSSTLHVDDAALFVQDAVAAVAGAAQLAGLGIPDFVDTAEANAGILGQLHHDGNILSEMGHGLVLCGDADHRHNEVSALHFGVAQTQLIHPVNAGFLEPADIIGVMDDGHLVGLIVLNVVDIWFEHEIDLLSECTMLNTQCTMRADIASAEDRIWE